MEDGKFETMLGITIVALLAVVSHITAYKLGRHLERKAYTAEFIPAIEATYAEGFHDGERQATRLQIITELNK